MIVERARADVLRITAHVNELATLVTAARWVVEGKPEHLPEEALDDLKRVLAGYDRGLAVMREEASRAGE